MARRPDLALALGLLCGCGQKQEAAPRPRPPPRRPRPPPRAACTDRDKKAEPVAPKAMIVLVVVGAPRAPIGIGQLETR